MRNIIVLGETGAGKSSLINMLVGKDVAATSDAATGCTFEATPYNDDYGNCYHDTVGLNESSKGRVSASDAIRSLSKLFKSLEAGVNLIIYVIRKGRITDAMVKNYTIFVHGICGGKVPVLLVVSGCELDSEDGDWFARNKKYFDDNALFFDACVSGCFTKKVGNTKPAIQQVILESYEETKDKMSNVLGSGMYMESYKFGTWFNWLKKAIGSIWNLVAKYYGWPQLSAWDTLKVALMTALGLNETEATALANELAELAQ